MSQQLLAFEISNARNSAIDDFQVLTDSTRTFTHENIINQPASNWASYSTPDFNLGYTQDTVWVRLRLTNSSLSDTTRILDITYPLLDLVTLYRLEDGRLAQNIKSGDTLDFSSRKIAHPNHLDLLTLKANTQNDFYIKIQSNSPIQTQFLVWDVNEFQKHYREETGLNFIYLGLILSIVIFNFFVYLFLRESVYLNYTIYAAFFALLMSSQNGILYEYIYPSTPWIQNWSQLAFAAGAISFTAIFNSSFLKMRPESIGRQALSVFSVIPLIVLIISPALGFALSIKLIVMCALIIIPLCFIIGIQYSKNRKDKRLYMLAWSWLIIGVVTFLLLKLGLIPFNPLTTNSIQIGSALELITFSIALARRIHTEKETRILAQEIIIESSKKTAQLHQEMLYNATHHPITDLPNLSAFEAEVERRSTNGDPFSIAYIHLSRISDINKTLGRKVSEEAFKVFSNRLQDYIKSQSVFFEVGKRSNVFSATLNSTTHAIMSKEIKPEILFTILQELKDSIGHPLKISNMEIEPYITASYVTYPEDGKDSSSLLRHADIALDRATIGGEEIVKYETKIDPYNEQRLNMMTELSRAIYSDKLTLHFQPLVDTHTKKILGAEALIRWPHQEYGLIMPDQFIQPAEQTGVIQALSLWVLRNAIKQQLIWTSQQPDFLLSVNISAFNLQDSKFIEAVNILFSDHKSLAKSIILEITESQMMTDTQHALKNLWGLSELGFHVAIDDFGTGYSNLAYLKKLPASELKIDKTFILNLESDKQNQMLVQTAIQMAHNLGMKVVAEGVESEHARSILSEMGCDMCQGFHFSRPIPADQFSNLFDSDKTKAKV